MFLNNLSIRMKDVTLFSTVCVFVKKHIQTIGNGIKLTINLPIEITTAVHLEFYKIACYKPVKKV